MSLIPVTKKNNPKFSGFASAEQIAANPNLVIVDRTYVAASIVEKAKEELEVKKTNEAAFASAKPSEPVKPSDIKRKPPSPSSDL